MLGVIINQWGRRLAVSKFDRLFRVAKDESELREEATAPDKGSIRPSGLHSGSASVVGGVKKGTAKSSSLKQVKGLTEAETRAGSKISGKRQHPDFVGLTTYIRKDIHRRVKIALLVEGQNCELSELVDKLLADWLQARAE